MSANNYLRLSRNKDNLFILEDCDAEAGTGYKVAQAVGIWGILGKASNYLRTEVVEYGLHLDDSLFEGESK